MPVQRSLCPPLPEHDNPPLGLLRLVDPFHYQLPGVFTIQDLFFLNDY